MHDHDHVSAGTALPGMGSERGESSLRLSEVVSFALAGITLGVAVAMTGHYMGERANARAIDDGEWVRLSSPASTISEKSAPLLPPSRLRAATIADAPASEIVEAPLRVVRSGKGDSLRPALRLASTAKEDRRRAVAAALVTSPPVWKLEKSWRLARSERQRILSERKRRLARKLAARKRFLRERACLTKALYFEARSEGARGQMAVARVILNRVKDPRFPNTICGVVYQGAERRNSCQFSFACDGKPDVATQPKAWAEARRIASKAMSGKLGMSVLAGATYYHADYVRPRWASAMRKIAKIGRHIFYIGG